MRKIGLLFLIFTLVLFFYFSLKLFSLISFYQKKGRINILFYDNSPIILSLDLKIGANYYVSLPLDLKIEVPGGYGRYRVGSIGKLAYLEKDPEILQRSFSFFLGSFVDYYFYPSLSSVWYSEGDKGIRRKKELLIYKSNAGVLERGYLFLKFFSLPSASFLPIKIKPEEIEENEINFLKFHSRIQGNFYLSNIRKENKKVKIFYSKEYDSARNLAVILKGEAFDVLDYEKSENVSECRIKTNAQSFSSEYLKEMLGCKIDFNAGVGENIIELYLSEKEEQKWR